MSILENLKAHLTAKKQSAHQRYVAMLERSDKSKPEDGEELASLMSELQISMEQLQTDTSAVKEIQDVSPHIIAAGERRTTCLAAEKSFREYIAETERLIEEVKASRQAELDRLSKVSGKAGELRNRSIDANQRLNRVNGSYKRLYPADPLGKFRD